MKTIGFYFWTRIMISQIFNKITLKVFLDKKKLECYHGSTNGIILNKYERLFLIHVNKNITSHRWLLFNIETYEITISSEFVFFNHSYIEFPCSLCKYNERIFISIGINDNKAFIIEVVPSDINNSFNK